jgi:hypothetical protein
LGGYPSVDALSVALDGDVSIAKAFAGNPLADPHIRELYRVFVGLLWHHARAICGNGLTEQLAEPLLGNPLRCSLGGRLISQDLANSIRECTVCLAPLEAELMSVRPLSMVEIGAGYGRLGFVLLTGTPCRYTVVDIPPALALAQWYLTTLLPQVPTFRFRPWHSFADVQSEMEGTDIRFLTPDQFALCPAGYFDLGITISTLPEMTRHSANSTCRSCLERSRGSSTSSNGASITMRRMTSRYGARTTFYRIRGASASIASTACMMDFSNGYGNAPADAGAIDASHSIARR